MIPDNLPEWKGRDVVVGLSGGVDSAVAALLLLRGGARVRAVFMKNWEDDDTEAGCHDKQDLITAAAVAETLDVPLDVVNFAAEYKQRVFAPFLQELRCGRTPNPDVLCNSEIKFAAFHAYAKDSAGAGGGGGDVLVATGHYARVARAPEGVRLYKAEESAKDQTYFLHRLTEAQLARSLFPLGEYYKADVRALAREAGLSNWQRRDSTGICFIGERRFDDFICRYLPENPGEMQDENGRVVGTHRGLQFYTIGQRRGIGIGGGNAGEGGGGNGDGAAWYVAAKEPVRNVLRVVRGETHPLLYRHQVRLRDAHWVAGAPPPAHWVYAARLRHRQSPASCTLSAVDATTATIEFPVAQRAVAPGQFAVIYDGDLCLGGGVIVDDDDATTSADAAVGEGVQDNQV